MAQTVGSKLVNMAGQVMLAWLLSPEDFGLIGLAYTVTAFAALLQQAGLREILIHRHRHFDRWGNPAFWMSLTLGCVGAVAMAIAAPVAAWMYEEPELIGLILVLAAVAPFGGLDVVPDAYLTSELRFRYLAVVRWITAVGTMGLSVLFAHWKLGAYSFVLPQPIIVGVRLALLWSAARVKIHRRPHFRRWRFLLNDSVLLFLAGFFVVLTWQGDYIVLGLMHDAKTVGIYFFAFNLSIQTMQVFTNNLTGVLFPALSKLQQDRQHQTGAFLRAARVLAIVGVPLCLVQAALAGPGIALLFNSWWYPAIRVLQLLSLGMAIRLVASPAGSLMQAQGRFGTYLVTSAINAVVFIGMVAGASFWSKGIEAAVNVAAAVMLYFMLVGPVFMYVAIRPGGGRWGDVWRVYLAPLAAGAGAVAGAALIGRQVPMMEHTSLRQVIRIVLILVLSAAFYVPLIRWMAWEPWRELQGRILGLVRGSWVYVRGGKVS